MVNPKEPQESILHELAESVNLYDQGAVTPAEVVNMLLSELIGLDRFDLAEAAARLLPDSIRQEMRGTIARILADSPGYHGPYVIGRPSEEWRTKVRNGLKPLALLLREILDRL